MENLVIVGSGAAGLTAAIYAARANLNPLVITGLLPGGLLTQTTDVENYPGFEEPINGYELMTHFQKQAERFGTRFLNATVKGAKLVQKGPQQLEIEGQEALSCRALVIAAGASPRWLGLESEKRLMNKGVSACATCDGAFFRNVPVLVIGGGDTAMEEALFLTRFASKVTVIHRRDQLRASKIMADRAMKNPKIEFIWNSVVSEVLGENEVDSARVKNLVSGEESIIPCKGYFAALGHVPNTQPFEGLEKNEAGYIKLEANSSRTSVEGVFAAGDCADHVFRQAITAAGMGCRAAIDAERWLESQS